MTAQQIEDFIERVIGRDELVEAYLDSVRALGTHDVVMLYAENDCLRALPRRFFLDTTDEYPPEFSRLMGMPVVAAPGTMSFWLLLSKDDSLYVGPVRVAPLAKGGTA